MNTNNKKLNPGLLELDLFCKGMKIDQSCDLEHDARMVTRTRAGLGSGLEIIIPAHPEDIYMNVPLLEKFVKDSPYTLIKRDGQYIITAQHYRNQKTPLFPLFARERERVIDYPPLIPPFASLSLPTFNTGYRRWMKQVRSKYRHGDFPHFRDII